MLSLPLILNVLQTIAVEDRTEVRARSVNDELVADVETDPQLKYKAEWKNGLDSFGLNYLPRIVGTNLTGPDTATVLQDAHRHRLAQQGELAQAVIRPGVRGQHEIRRHADALQRQHLAGRLRIEQARRVGPLLARLSEPAGTELGQFDVRLNQHHGAGDGHRLAGRIRRGAHLG